MSRYQRKHLRNTQLLQMHDVESIASKNTGMRDQPGFFQRTNAVFLDSIIETLDQLPSQK